MSWSREGIPRDVEPAVAGKELVGMFTGLEEGDEALELGGMCTGGLSPLCTSIRMGGLPQLWHSLQTGGISYPYCNIKSQGSKRLPQLMRLEDYQSIEESRKEGDSLFKSKIMQNSNRYFHYLITITEKYAIFVIAIRKERKTYCSMVSQSPHEKKRAIQLKLGLPHYGRRLPISVVVCGEPRDLW